MRSKLTRFSLEGAVLVVMEALEDYLRNAESARFKATHFRSVLVVKGVCQTNIPPQP
jgi:hypothetical protein